MKNKLNPSDALNTVVRTLEALSITERKRVIAAASAFVLENAHIVDKQLRSGSSVDEMRSTGIEEVVSRLSSLRPGKKAAVVAYYLMKKSGSDKFTLNELRKLYDDIGQTPPDRFDMTLKSAVVKGNKLFKTAGRNNYALTFHGQEYGKKINTIS